MSAVLGGAMRSPLTGVIFALELTHDISALLPLLVAGVTAHGFSVLMLKRSILTEKIGRHGYHLSREYAVDPHQGFAGRGDSLSSVAVASSRASMGSDAISDPGYSKTPGRSCHSPHVATNIVRGLARGSPVSHRRRQVIARSGVSERAIKGGDL